MKKLIFALLLLPTSALADPPAQFTLTVTAQDINVIGTALANRPFGEVHELVTRLNAQIAAQAKKPDAETKDEPEKR